MCLPSLSIVPVQRPATEIVARSRWKEKKRGDVKKSFCLRACIRLRLREGGAAAAADIAFLSSLAAASVSKSSDDAEGFADVGKSHFGQSPLIIPSRAWTTQFHGTRDNIPTVAVSLLLPPSLSFHHSRSIFKAAIEILTPRRRRFPYLLRWRMS